MKTELTMEESLKREKGMIFPQDFSEKTLLAVAHSRNCIEAMEKQIPKQVGYIVGAFGEKYECPECGSALIDTDLFAGHCKWCGQAIKDN